MDEIVLATRGSALALAQAQWVGAALQAVRPGLSIRMLIVHTRGDRISTGALAEGPGAAAAGTGEFVREVQQAVLAGEAHAAVHSLKDLPLRGPEGLVTAAVPARGDVREALVSPGARLEDLPAGARVGTSSPRRRAFLRHLRPDLAVLEMRGNLDTRLRRLEAGVCDALVVAAAGLGRLGMTDRVTQYFLPEVFLPAPGQGALAVEARADDTVARELMARIDDPRTRQAVWAERAMLESLGGGCRVPVGAWARREEGELVLTGAYAPGGEGLARVTLRIATGPGDLEAARGLGERAGGQLLALARRGG
ncbi:MAG: hydroxymethylbilane synthase [Bacillota bacterium]|nr:hydroxymethylbilane synthase [Bacillota bacterium]